MAATRTDSVTLYFNEKDFILEFNENGYLTIESEKPISYPESNEPGLPLISADIVIPGGSRYLSSTSKYNKRLIKNDVQIAQSPLPVITDSLSQYSSSPKISYNTLSIYPNSNCKYMSSSNWDNAVVCHFLTCPFVYDSKEHKLYFIDTIDLTIESSDEHMTQNRIKSFVNPHLLKSFVSNTNNVDDIILNQHIVQQASDRIDYVIITNNALKSSFEPLIKWKKKKGLYSKIITVEEIESNYTGNSSQLKLKNCLYDLYSNNSLKYVLLGGDDTVVPVQGCYGFVTKNYVDTNIPTDLYYACFGGNFEWNQNGNGIYGEIEDNIDLAQSIYITRVPIRQAEEVKAFVDKLLEYEQNPKYNNNILMCGNKLWEKIPSSSQSDAEAKGDNLYDNFISPYWNGVRYKFYDTYTDFPEGADYNLISENLKQQLSKGYSFMDMATHGSQTFWSLESGDSYRSSHGNLQTNASATIITTMACLTNAFDSSTSGGRQDPCLSESLIRNPSSGVVAYLGCSRYGWGYSGGTRSLGPSLQYESHFYKNLFSSALKEKNYGIVVAASKAAMVAQSSKYGAERWVQFGLNPIGDPEMPVFVSAPNMFNNVKINFTGNSTTINTGIPDCRICIMSANDHGNSYYRVYENSQSLVLTDLPVNCSICITKQGYVPKQYSLCIIQNETLTGTNIYSNDIVMFGNSFTTQKSSGPVILKSGGKTTVDADVVVIESETVVEKGAELIINNTK